MELNKAEKLAYSSLLIGSAIDHISTRIGITHPLIFETNVIVAWAMSVNLWIWYELLTLTLIIIFAKKVYNVVELQLLKSIVLTVPALIGALRLIIGFANIGLWINLIS